jgi:type I restriction enzyme S subunit
VCPVGSVLVVVRSGILAHTLPVTVTEVPVTVNQDLKAFFSEEPLLNEWLALFLRMSAHELLASSRRDGTTVQSVQYPLLKNTAIPVPPLDERRLIIETVDIALAKQASVPPRLAAARRAIERFRQAVLAAACSGRLTADWRDEHPGVHAVSIDTARQRRQMQFGRRFREPHPNAHADTASLPNSWEVGPLGLLLHEIKYGTSKRSEYGVPGTSVLRIPNVSGERLGIADLKSATLDVGEAESLRLRLGDLLMIRSNGSVQLVGKTLPVTEEAVGMAYAGYLLRLRTDDEVLDPEFLAMVLASPLLRRQIEMPARSTSGVNNINTDEVRGLIVPIPPLDEQREIVTRISEMFDSANILLTRIEAASRRVDRCSQAVLAVTIQVAG